MKLPLLVTRLPQFPLPIPVVKFSLVGLMPQQGPPPVVVVVDPVMVVVVLAVTVCVRPAEVLELKLLSPP